MRVKARYHAAFIRSGSYPLPDGHPAVFKEDWHVALANNCGNR